MKSATTSFPCAIRTSNPEFNEVVTKQERNPETKLIVKAHNIDMAPSGTYSAITLVKVAT